MVVIGRISHTKKSIENGRPQRPKVTGRRANNFMLKSHLILIGLIVLFSTNSYAFTLHFWDANGSSPGATTENNQATGTWGVDPFWTENPNGTTDTTSWPSGQIAVFAAGNDAFGTYTVTVQDTQQVVDIHVDSGQVTFQGGNLNLDASGVRLLSVGHKDPNAVARYNTVLSGANGIIRYKQGILILGATNTYAGSTTIEGGVLRLGASHVMPTNSSLILANNDVTRGDFSPEWQFVPATFETDGFSQQLGTLRLGGVEASVQRVIDFGNASSALSFADSGAENWSGLQLTVLNYTPGADTLRFGENNNGLTLAQLELIQFANLSNLPGQIDANGFVTPMLPVFLSVQRTPPSHVELTWSAVSGRNYRVQFKESLNEDWINLTPDIFAFGATSNFSDTTATSTNRFYRVQVLP